jgi:hypothetical protein
VLIFHKIEGIELLRCNRRFFFFNFDFAYLSVNVPIPLCVLNVKRVREPSPDSYIHGSFLLHCCRVVVKTKKPSRTKSAKAIIIW